eukprot:TRINITY_DN11602_c0_g1_i1.p1 TRINITY_DN11602_c0_g1~~TRINITY_DN11602_c0_g1_i1.p1  ORF type:complete len:164 (-),score=30.86 TRINITY_DN11602_c0_g1_i1:326-796(-)
MHHNLGDINYKLSGPDDLSGGSEIVEDLIHTNLKISGTKSSIGRLLGASGAIEAALTLNALKTMTAPPTRNLEIPDDIVPKYVNLVPNEPQQLSSNTRYAMSNSFGFGGTNACLVFKKEIHYNAVNDDLLDIYNYVVTFVLVVCRWFRFLNFLVLL